MRLLHALLVASILIAPTVLAESAPAEGVPPTTCGPGPGGATCDGTGPASQGNASGTNQGAGNPINVITGNKYQREVDLPALPGVLGLEIVRHYNSSLSGPNAANGILGRGWRLSYETDLYVVGNTLQIVQADGTRIIFVRDPKHPSQCATNDPARGKVSITRTAQGDAYTWTWRNGRRLRFNHQGKLIQISAPTGEFVTLTRDLSGALVKVTDPQGRSLVLGYPQRRSPDRFNGVTHIDTPVGRFAYAHGTELPKGSAAAPRELLANLAQVTLPDGVMRHYHYEDAAHPTLLTGITVEGKGSDGRFLKQRVSTWAYDAQGRGILSYKGEKPKPGEAGIEQVRLAFPAPGTTRLTNSLGQVTTYRHAIVGGEYRLLEVKGAGCASCGESNMKYGYDKLGRLNEQTKLSDQGRPIRATRTEYDPRGRVARVSRIAYTNGKPGSAQLAVRYEYGGGNTQPSLIVRPSVIPGKEHQIRIAYNVAGQPTAITETGYSPQPIGPATPIERSTTYTYAQINGRSLLAATDGPLKNGPRNDSNDSDVTRYEWDKRGNAVIAEVRPGGFTDSLQYDHVGRLVFARFEDGHRRIDTAFGYASHGAMALKFESITRNAWRLENGRPQDESRITQTVLRARHDALGRRTQNEGLQGGTRTVQYDHAGRPTNLLSGAGEQLQFAYDAEGQLLAQISTNPQGDVSDGDLWLRDERGRLRATLKSQGLARIYAYLGENDVRRASKGNQRAAQRTPQHMRPNGPGYPNDTSSGTSLYDDFGRQVFQSRPEDGQLVTVFENLPGRERQTQIQHPRATSDSHAEPEGTTIREAVVFDGAGRLIERDRNRCAEILRYEGALLVGLQGCGNTHLYTRDALGLITQHEQRFQTDGGPTLIFTHHYRYDKSGRLLTRTLPDGRVLAYGYDKASRTQSVMLQRAWRSRLARAVGEETALVLTEWLPQTWSHQVLVDDTQYRPFATGPAALQGLTDGSGHRQEWRPLSFLRASFSSVGRRASATDHSDRYDTLGRRILQTPASGPHRGRPQHLIWDDANQLVQVRDQASNQLLARYRYDSLGNRVAKTVYGPGGQVKSSWYIYNSSRKLVAEADATGNIERQYLYADHRPHSMVDHGRVLAISADWRGLPFQASDTNGARVWSGPFDDWGGAIEGRPAQDGGAIPLRFAGQVFDAETGLHYNIHRYYDPQAGRYITPDPLGTPDGADRYAYLNGDPHAGIDPLGLFKIPAEYFLTGYVGGVQHTNTLSPASIGDHGHGDILRIAFSLYNQQHGQRFSQTIIDQIILHNYHSDALSWNGGQLHEPNHFDNPNTGPYQLRDPNTGAVIAQRYNVDWFPGDISELNGWRTWYDDTDNGNISKILNAFGRNSHALADFYAHSNWVDAPYRGGCYGINWVIDGQAVRLGAWAPIGLNQYTVWDETERSGLFSGTVCFTCGDIGSNTDLKHTHAYWAKDEEDHIGGADTIDYRKLWGLPAQFQSRYEVKPDGTVGYSVVKASIDNKYDLAFHLAVLHTLKEIDRLWTHTASQTIDGTTINLHSSFGFAASELADMGVKYQAFFDKKAAPPLPATPR